MREFDFVVVGSGIAGLSFALKAARHGSVAIVTKGQPGDSNTAWAQGGVACVMGAEDSFEQHIADTLDAGAGLCKEEVVRTIVSEGPERMRTGREISDRLLPPAPAGREDDAVGAEGELRRISHQGHTVRGSGLPWQIPICRW